MSELKVCKKGQSWRHALELWNNMETNKLQPNVECYNCVISICAKVCQYKEAFEFLHEMERQPDIQPNVITYSLAINACAKASQCKEALDLLWEMKTGAQGKEALNLLGGMKRGSKSIQQPNRITYSSAIHAFAKSRRLSTCWGN